MLQRICQILIFLLPMICQQAQAQIFTPQHPIYIVNGVRMQEAQVKAIDPEDIVENKLLQVDEQTIAKYGQEASNGVMLITLRYDTPASFRVDGKEQSFSSFVAYGGVEISQPCGEGDTLVQGQPRWHDIAE